MGTNITCSGQWGYRVSDAIAVAASSALPLLTVRQVGVLYEVANGHQTPIEGEKKFTAVTEESAEKNIVLQVADVNQGISSVSKVVSAGNRVVKIDPAGSYIQNAMSGQKTWLQERGGMYILKLWVKRSFF